MLSYSSPTCFLIVDNRLARSYVHRVKTGTSRQPTAQLEPLAGVCDRIFVGLSETRHRETGGQRYPIINVRDLQDGRILPHTQLLIRSVSDNSDLARYAVAPGDVVLTCRGTQFKVGMVTPESAGALISANLIAIRTNARMLPPVLFALLQSPAVRGRLSREGQSSGANLTLNPRTVSTLPIPVPPLEVQRQIADLVVAAEEHYAAAIAAANLRRSVALTVSASVLRGGTTSHPRGGHAKCTS